MRCPLTPEAHILSYFSVETDLAAEFLDWPEFLSGSGDQVVLASAEGTVSILLVPSTDGEPPFVRLRASAAGSLFERALGRAAYALAAHSDYVWIDRVS